MTEREGAAEGERAAMAGLRLGLGALREARRTSELPDLALAALAGCGFDRGVVTRIDGSLGHPVAAHIEGDAAASAALLQLARSAPLRLDHHVLETELLRRRTPLLVTDTRSDPRVHPAILAVTRSRGYVAAPIVAEDRVRAFLHADRVASPRPVDAFDRDVLGALAEGVSAAWERLVVVERLRALRQGVRRDHASVLAIMDEFSGAEIEVAHVDGENAELAQSAAAMFTGGETRLEALLTRRELDVMKLMAAGETNSSIAEELVVSQGTVKSHVKHILRKLRAKNRAEAVSRYIKLAQRQGVH